MATHYADLLPLPPFHVNREEDGSLTMFPVTPFKVRLDDEHDLTGFTLGPAGFAPVHNNTDEAVVCLSSRDAVRIGPGEIRVLSLTAGESWKVIKEGRKEDGKT